MTRRNRDIMDDLERAEEAYVRRQKVRASWLDEHPEAQKRPTPIQAHIEQDNADGHFFRNFDKLKVVR